MGALKLVQHKAKQINPHHFFLLVDSVSLGVAGDGEGDPVIHEGQ